MNSTDLKDNKIMLDGISIKLPTVMGNPSALSSATTFEKPNWMSDAETSACLNCNQKFSQFRRKHHCRNCGKIFCAKCSAEKIPLPHFGMNDPEKVCINCKMIVELMVKARSSHTDEKLEAIIGFSSLLKNAAGLSKLIECGGIHMMLALAGTDEIKLKSAVALALHNMTQTMVLNSFLVEAGCLKVIKNFLSTSFSSSDLLTDSLSALSLLCMDPNIKLEVLKEGMIDSLLATVNSSSGVTSVFACRILQQLVCNFDFHEFILQNHQQLIPDLFEALQTEDYQMQGCVSKILMHLSAGSSHSREKIVQEDVKNNFLLLQFLKGTSQAILVNVTCLISNLSLVIDRNYVHHYITGMCELLSFVNEENTELLTQLARGLANFAEFPANALHMIHNLPLITSSLLKSEYEGPRVHACRILIYLFATELPCALDILSQSGMSEFIGTIFDLPGITEILNNLFLRKVSRLSVCNSA